MKKSLKTQKIQPKSKDSKKEITLLPLSLEELAQASGGCDPYPDCCQPWC